MRLSRILRVGCCVLFIFAPYVTSTVLTATMLTSFMGGFLMGKMTLGTFLMMVQGLNNGQQKIVSSGNRESSPAIATPTAAAATPVAAAVAAPTTAAATQAENDIRDKFLNQLGQMDPLNCLPKVFCELSSPQNVQVLDDGADDDEKHNDDTENSDEGDDENSDSEEAQEDQEGFDEEDELNDRLENRKKKQNLKLENDALDALLEESQDPTDYYFILKDKMKLRPKYNPNTASHPPFFPKKPSNFLKKRGHSSNQYIPDNSEYKAQAEAVVKPKTNKNIDDIFADDPFFDDFARSMKFSPETVDYRRVGRQLRRIEADTGDFRRKYRVAATVGQKSAQSCQYVFHTCPFKASQIMSMVNTMKRKNGGLSLSQASSEVASISTTTAPAEVTNKVGNKTTTDQKKENLQNLKNTLLAIESLNNITLMAQTAGLPVSYNQILADIAENEDLDVTGVSSKILDDLEKEASSMNVTPNEDNEQEEADPLEEAAEVNVEVTTKKSSKRRKTMENKNKNRSKYRIVRNKSGDKKRSGISKRSLRFRMSRASSSEESFEMPSHHDGEIPIPAILKLDIPDPELVPIMEAVEESNFDGNPIDPEDVGRLYFLKEEFEDDEAIASEEESQYTPSFDQFTPNKKRVPIKKRPQKPPPKLQLPQNLGGNYNRRRYPTTTEIPRPSNSFPPGYNYNSESVLFGTPNRPQVPTIPPRRKITTPIEDDEADASESDRAVEKIIATRHQIKFRPFNYRTSKESTSSENATLTR